VSGGGSLGSVVQDVLVDGVCYKRPDWCTIVSVGASIWNGDDTGPSCWRGEAKEELGELPASRISKRRLLSTDARLQSFHNYDQDSMSLPTPTNSEGQNRKASKEPFLLV